MASCHLAGSYRRASVVGRRASMAGVDPAKAEREAQELWGEVKTGNYKMEDAETANANGRGNCRAYDSGACS